MGASVITATEATAAEEAKVEDTGTAVTLAKNGMISLVRTAGRASLAKAPGETSLVRTVLRATLAFLHCRHHQEGMTTTTRTRGLGASRSLVPSPASWAALRPRLSSHLQAVRS
jgi:hypothetical protein